MTSGGAPNSAAIKSGGTALFVRRPVLAIVLNLLIVVAGLAGLYGAEIRELPDIDRPVVTITTDFAGASPETIDREVTAIVEGAVARVPGVSSMSSTSSFGRSRVTVEFTDATDLAVAASDIRDSIGSVANTLPDDIDEPRIVKADANADPVMRLAVTSPSMSIDELTILVEDEIVDRLAAVNGVADVSVNGNRDRIFRIDVDQSRLAAFGLTIADVGAALDDVAYDVPAGSLTANAQDIAVRATADVKTPADFDELRLNENIKLRDVATVTLGPDINVSSVRANGQTGIGLGIIRQANSNTLEISDGVRAVAEELKSALPEGTGIRVTSDDANFIRGAIKEVEIALLMSIGIVVAIIYLFLLDWRATIVPAVTLPVALVGTVAAIYMAGFSINILTLLALVLATGMVVDDAIVVLENIVRKRNEGLGPRAAAVVGTREVFFAVVATTATLAAVFIPISFLPGQAGSLFREFGFVLAFSVMLSGVVALTLGPMLASRLIGTRAKPASVPQPREQAHPGADADAGGWMARLYSRSLRAVLNAPLVVISLAGLVSAAALILFVSVPRELTPPEDRSVVLLRISAPQGVSLDFTQSRMRDIERELSALQESGEIRNVLAISGTNNSASSGFMVLTLAPWSERSRGQGEIAGDINRMTARVPGVRAFLIQPNSLGIRGAGSGLQFALAGGNFGELGAAAKKLTGQMEVDGRFQQVRLSYETTQPQLSISIDRKRAADLGIEIGGLAQALQALLDGREVAQVFIEDRSYPVKLVSVTAPINDPTDLEAIYIRAGDGRNVPMSTIATLVERPVAPELRREQQLRAVSITASLPAGYAIGDAYGDIVDMAQRILPPGARVIPLAEAATLNQSSTDLAFTFAIAIVVILLVLAAQFESFVSAIIIMATVPVGLACAVFALVVTGGSLNLYSQIGLVLLVGIMAKNGILIVEFANQLRNRGRTVRAAVEEAARIRLRPVMMTMISTVLGALPLVFATGAGAEARIALGWIMVGGLGLATLATLFLTPVAYLLLAGLSKPSAEEEDRLHAELSANMPAE